MALTPLTPQLAEELELPRATSGLVVTGVDPSGLAASAGMQPGDVIKSVNGQAVASVASLRSALEAAARPPGARAREPQGRGRVRGAASRGVVGPHPGGRSLLAARAASRPILERVHARFALPLAPRRPPPRSGPDGHLRSPVAGGMGAGARRATAVAHSLDRGHDRPARPHLCVGRARRPGAARGLPGQPARGPRGRRRRRAALRLGRHLSRRHRVESVGRRRGDRRLQRARLHGRRGRQPRLRVRRGRCVAGRGAAHRRPAGRAQGAGGAGALSVPGRESAARTAGP